MGSIFKSLKLTCANWCLALRFDIVWIRKLGRNPAVDMPRFCTTKLELWRHYVLSASIGLGIR